MADKRRAGTAPRAACPAPTPPRTPPGTPTRSHPWWLPAPRHRPNLVLCLGLALAALAACANRLRNDFHFDDSHTIVYNRSISDLRHVPRFFADGPLFRVSPMNAAYRPVTSVSLAIDYWLGRGLKPFYFHLSTFVSFLVQLVLMFFLFRRLRNLSARRNLMWAVSHKDGPPSGGR